MIAVVLLCGILVGWGLTWLADMLPRFSTTPPAAVPERSAGRLPALLRALLRLVQTRDVRAQDWLDQGLAAEVACALFFAFAWLQDGVSLEALGYSSSFSFFLLVTLIDLRYRLVLNVLTYPGIAAVIAVQLLLNQDQVLNVILGGVLTFGIFALTAMLRPGQLGGGDVKLATLIGFAFGFPNVLWALLLGTGAGGLMTVYLLATRRGGLKASMAYAPFLCLGAMLALLVRSPFVV